jgi:NADH dehydrogenase FAD-containing subunit
LSFVVVTVFFFFPHLGLCRIRFHPLSNERSLSHNADPPHTPRTLVAQINNKVRYVEATATSVDLNARTVSCVSVSCEGNSCETIEFDVPYDRLLFSVGARTTTFGTPGVEEYCNYLKQVGDAQQIKNAIVNCFENAPLPARATTPEEKSRELTFVIVGAGPTGVEFAAELLDFIEGDGPRYYKDLLP